MIYKKDYIEKSDDDNDDKEDMDISDDVSKDD